MKPLIIQVTNGVTTARLTMISASRVSSNPRLRNITKNGSTTTTAGMNYVARMMKNRNLRATSWNREKE